MPTHSPVNYFKIAEAIISSSVPSSISPPRIFASSTTAFCLAVKPSLRISINKAAKTYGLPDLWLAVTTLIVSWDTSKYATPPLRKCKIGAKFEFSNQVIMIDSPSNHHKLLSPLLCQHNSPMVSMTLLSLVRQLKVIGLQTV